MFDLISNVILLESEKSPGREFHFRFAMEDTGVIQKPRSADAGETQGTVRGLLFPAAGRLLDAGRETEASGLKRVTNMLICGEDLGMVPACVPELMKQLGLLSLEIQRMPKEMDRKFSPAQGRALFQCRHPVDA